MPRPIEMLCQDCLRVRPYSAAGHAGDEHCECGGDFCGCESCLETISGLRAGKRLASELDLRSDVKSWDAILGCN
ncbi:MAG: hypothetical protein ACRC9O_02220 [Plesiomonas sp.]|uniref:hypothetical protein n=1 Tax=Plesiomonas sp. TaxID=2486279 RepID=UPI003F2BD9C4